MAPSSKEFFRRDFHDAGQDKRHDADEPGVAAARRLESGGDAGALVSLALGKGAVAAGIAIAARDVMMQSDTVADAESLRTATSADFDDGADGFVAEDARGRDGAVLDFFDVGGADAADGDFDEQFICADGRHGHGFEAEVVNAAINDGAHGFGDAGHAGNPTVDYADNTDFLQETR